MGLGAGQGGGVGQVQRLRDGRRVEVVHGGSQRRGGRQEGGQVRRGPGKNRAVGADHGLDAGHPVHRPEHGTGSDSGSSDTGDLKGQYRVLQAYSIIL